MVAQASPPVLLAKRVKFQYPDFIKRAQARGFARYAAEGGPVQWI
jgi:hypothetical protein